MSLVLRMGDQVITHLASNIQTKNIWQGGYASVTFNVKRKLDQSLFDTFTDVMTYDPMTGEQTGGGRLLEQGRNDDGTWSVTCLGEGLASMQDVTTPWFAIDQNLDNWRLSLRSTRRLDFNTSPYPSSSTPDEPNLFMDPTDSVSIATNSQLVITNRIAEKCDMYYGAIIYRIKSGITTATWETRVRAYALDLSGWVGLDAVTWNTAITSSTAKVCGTDFTSCQVLGIQWVRTGSAATTGEDTWSVVRDVYLRSQLYGPDGTLNVGAGFSDPYVSPQEVLTDWVVRYCPRLDVSTGTIDGSSTTQIEQLAYLDGIHGMQLADDVAALEPGFIWQVWDQDEDGTWPFYYVPLPTTVQYEASTDDGFTAPAPSTEIYDEVVVTGKTLSGRDTNLMRTSTVPALDAAGIHRRITIPLGSEAWSTGAATKVGDEFLDEHAVAPNAGTVTIARKIYDAIAGRYVAPSHIRAGGLMRIRGIQPTPDTLNATGSDGVTVFRVVSATYDDDSGSCVCELDSYTLTESRAISELARARTRRTS